MTEFETHLTLWRQASVDRYAPEYIKSMERHLKAFGRWLSQNALSAESATETDILSFMAHHNRKGGDTARGLISFYEWLVQWGVVEQSPAAGLSPFKKSKMARAALTPEAVNEYLNQCYARIDDPTGRLVTWIRRVKVWAMAELIFSSGLTTGQLCEIRPEDVNLKELTLRTGSRIIPITRQAAWAVAYWRLIDIAFQNSSPTYLFRPSRIGAVKISAHHLTSDFKAIGREIGEEISPLDLRYAFIVSMLDRNFSKEDMAYILGLTRLDSLRDIGN
ncbi:site-specific integrase [Devosia sp. LjRoot3]|uniref:site-specific integrase n=1 Tax=Devosia sp. LjRoot3 TaxID=3342319 RepID=UPI003ECE9D09